MEGKESIYQKSKLGFQIGYGKRPAVIVVDLQKFFTQDIVSDGCDMASVIRHTNMILDAAREKNVKVFFVQQGYQSPHGIDLGAWGLKCHADREYMRTHENFALDDRLHVKDTDVRVVKHWASAFFGSHLAQMLVNLQVDTAILMGATTSGCLGASITDAISHGYRTIVPQEACWDRSVDVNEMFLWNIGQKFADVVKTEEIVGYLNRLAPLTYDNLW